MKSVHSERWNLKEWSAILYLASGDCCKKLDAFVRWAWIQMFDSLHEIAWNIWKEFASSA